MSKWQKVSFVGQFDTTVYHLLAFFKPIFTIFLGKYTEQCFKGDKETEGEMCMLYRLGNKEDLPSQTLTRWQWSNTVLGRYSYSTKFQILLTTYIMGSWAHLELECHIITINKIHQYVVMKHNQNQGYHLRESSPGCW
jgi:hypothetical protein